jgi:hypothetical protein
MGQLFIALMVFVSDLFGRFRRWLTFRRVLGLVALLILALCLKGLIFDLGMGADALMLFSIDWGLAIEVSALMIALSAREYVAAIVHVVKRWLVQRKLLNRLMRRAFRRSSRSRPAAPLLPPPPEDDHPVFAFAAAFSKSPGARVFAD